MNRLAYLWKIAQERMGRRTAFDFYQVGFTFDSPPEQHRYETIINAVRELRGDHWGTALDAGCARGLFTKQIAHCCQSVLALDISRIACEMTAKECQPFENVRVRQADLQREEIGEQFNVVFALDMLAYVHGATLLSNVIDKLARAVNPEGLLVFSDTRNRTGTVSDTLWRRAIPSGADHHLLFLDRHPCLRRLRTETHESSDPTYEGYMPHLWAIFQKFDTMRSPEAATVL